MTGFTFEFWRDSLLKVFITEGIHLKVFITEGIFYWRYPLEGIHYWRYSLLKVSTWSHSLLKVFITEGIHLKVFITESIHLKGFITEGIHLKVRRDSFWRDLFKGGLLPEFLDLKWTFWFSVCVRVLDGKMPPFYYPHTWSFLVAKPSVLYSSGSSLIFLLVRH